MQASTVFISGALQKHGTPRRLCCATAVPMAPEGLRAWHRSWSNGVPPHLPDSTKI
jgi:hypothetical protein